MSTDSGADSAARAKRLIALSSVAAGIGLTLFKVAIGLATGSLGILAEAAHSGLDLVAALMTFLAVRLADRPPDPSHPYGHGKVENLSAFLEAGLLLVTAAWIGFEAVQRLVVHQIHVQASAWAFLVMGVSIVVDVSRSRALRRAAHKYGSQALEADALHFSTDIWSSAVVVMGLAAIKVGDMTGWPGPWEQADALAALGVCAVVAYVWSKRRSMPCSTALPRPWPARSSRPCGGCRLCWTATRPACAASATSCLPIWWSASREPPPFSKRMR